MSVTIGSGHEGNVRQQIDAYVARVKGGEMGALPSLLSHSSYSALCTPESIFLY